MLTVDEIPKEVIEAEKVLSDFFRSQNSADWQLGHSASREQLEEMHSSIKELFSIIRRMSKRLSDYERLGDPTHLYLNLLRGIPAQLSKEQLLHLAGSTQQPLEEDALRAIFKKMYSENAEWTQFARSIEAAHGIGEKMI